MASLTSAPSGAATGAAVPLAAVVVAGPSSDVEIGGLPCLDRAVLNLVSSGIRHVALVGARPDQLERVRRRRDARSAYVHRRCDLRPDCTHSAVWVTSSEAVLSRGAASAAMALVGEGPEAFGEREAWPLAALVYLPPGHLDLLASRLDGSDPIAELADELGARPRPLPGHVLARVETAPHRDIESRLLGVLVKPTDGPVSRWLNRPLSLACSRYLARWHVSPNAITTFVFLFTLVGAALATSTQYLNLAIAGLVFQLASVLDGCDGEVSRLSYRGTRWGGWYDTISDNVRYFAFYGALGVSLYRSTGLDLYVWATVAFVILATFASVTMARYVWATQEHLTNLAVTARVESLANTTRNPLARLVLRLRWVVKQDVNALLCTTCLLLHQVGLFFWGAFAGTLLMTVSVLRALEGPNQHRSSIRQQRRRFRRSAG